MTRVDFLEIINKIVEPSTPLKEESLISDCDEIDSLSLLSIFLEAKKTGVQCSITDFIKCVSIGDIISLVVA